MKETFESLNADLPYVIRSSLLETGGRFGSLDSPWAAFRIGGNGSIQRRIHAVVIMHI
jgi:hypothetical protein